MLRFYEDPGHGWLEVPVSELKQLGILDDITPYSYVSRNGMVAYLEEDLDAGVYMRAAGLVSSGRIEWDKTERVYQEKTFIRGLPSIAKIQRQPGQLELV